MRTLAIACVVLSIVGAGCSSAPSIKFDFELQPVTIVTEPAGAEVFQTLPLGQPKMRLGSSPLNGVNVMVIKGVSLNDVSAYEAQSVMRYVGNIGIEIRKDGFEPYVGLLAVKRGEKNEHRISLEPLATK